MRIRSLDSSGSIVKQYESARKAADDMGVNTSSVSRAASGITGSCGGLKWEWEEHNESTADEVMERHNLDKARWDKMWLKEDGVSILVSNPNKADDSAVSIEEIMKDFRKEMKQHSPKYPKLKRKKIKDGHLLVIDPADLHIGKLGITYENYNTAKALKRAEEGVDGLIQKAQGYPIDQVLLIIGNDVLHTDNTKRTTTSGTPQDTDRSWYENFQEAKKLYIRVIEKLLTVADVHVVQCPSNHDLVSGVLLSEAVGAWFHNNKNVTFDLGLMHRKYFKYGNSLISASHGDGAKIEQMPLLMAEEAKEDWAKTDFRYVYLHHLHHKQAFKFRASKDFVGVSVEFLRSPSGTDVWHQKNGYTGCFKAIEGFIHSKEGGQVARLSHLYRD